MSRSSKDKNAVPPPEGQALTREPWEVLSDLLNKHGHELCSDSRRLEALLRDHLKDDRRFVSAIIGSAKEQIPTDLQALPKDGLTPQVFSHLIDKLCTNLWISQEGAHWAVMTWAQALVLITPADLPSFALSPTLATSAPSSSLVTALKPSTVSTAVTLPPPPPRGTGTARFVDNGDNTITDTKHGMMWIKDTSLLEGSVAEFGVAIEMSFDAAIQVCKNLKYAGHADWRLPEVKELMDLCDEGMTCFKHIRNKTIAEGRRFWTGTADKHHPGKVWACKIENKKLDKTPNWSNTMSFPFLLLRPAPASAPSIASFSSASSVTQTGIVTANPMSTPPSTLPSTGSSPSAKGALKPGLSAPQPGIFQQSDLTAKKTRTNPSSNPQREALLRQSIDLVRGEPKNESAVSDIVKQALDAGFYHLVTEAIQTFSPDSNHSLCWGIARAFEPRYLVHISESLANYCEQRLEEATECRAGMYTGDHRPDLRSEALGKLGIFYLFCNDHSTAIRIWQLADDRYDVDEAIADMCCYLAEEEPKDLAKAMALIDLVSTKTVKAKTIARISKLS